MSATSSTIGSAGVPAARHDIVIVGAGAAGIATAASLLRRERSLDIALVDPAGTHYYQPGWTLVGGGVFEAPATARPMEAVLPARRDAHPRGSRRVLARAGPHHAGGRREHRLPAS